MSASRRAPSANDESDEDGGVHVKEIVKQKQKVKDKQTKKEESKAKKKEKGKLSEHLVDEDEDGGVVDVKPKVKSPSTKKKSSLGLCFRQADVNEDGATSKDKLAAAEKKKKKAVQKAIKTKVANDNADDDDDEDGGPKHAGSGTVTRDTRHDDELDIDDEDEDGGRIVKTYDTVKKIMPIQRPVLHTGSSTARPSAEDKIKSRKQKKTTVAPSDDTVNNLILKPRLPTVKKPTEPRASTSDFHFEPVSSDEDDADLSNSTEASTWNPLNGIPKVKVNLLRSGSYRRALHRSPPAISRRLPLHEYINESNETTHLSDIALDRDEPAVDNIVSATVPLPAP